VQEDKTNFLGLLFSAKNFLAKHRDIKPRKSDMGLYCMRLFSYTTFILGIKFYHNFGCTHFGQILLYSALY
jgi:hypothetical protein